MKNNVIRHTMIAGALCTALFVPLFLQAMKIPTISNKPEDTNYLMQMDINRDGSKEAAVFYKSPEEIGMILLEQDGSEWALKDQRSFSSNTFRKPTSTSFY